ncbi:hypothetical protein V8G54_007132 [Vigna mungo]|uniref:Uncharacterized protein n=1 Tax=Vigna mungo TaxID=3915 RepID=A0AAQ3P2R0_VIGMU
MLLLFPSTICCQIFPREVLGILLLGLEPLDYIFFVVWVYFCCPFEVLNFKSICCPCCLTLGVSPFISGQLFSFHPHKNWFFLILPSSIFVNGIIFSFLLPID